MTGRMARVFKILIPAVGGQGGGLLMDWLIRAARHAGLAARGVALPGLSQRAGGTAYFVELVAGGAGADPLQVPGLFPVPGDIDLILAQEFLELGRALQAGYATPDRTLVIGNTHRFLGTLEKLPGGPGVYPSAVIEAAAGRLARQLVLLNAPALARSHNLGERAVNAVLAGALAATDALPIPVASWQVSIREGGVAVEDNLSGFAVGLQHRLTGAPAAAATAIAAADADALGRRGGDYHRVWARIRADFPAPLHRVLGEAADLLTDYQDVGYAGEYLDRVAPFAAAEPGWRAAAGLPADGFALTTAMARQIGRWMMYEDVPRVADLKSRPQRFRRLLQQYAGRGEVLRVVDYLAPEPWDLYTLLPHGLVRLVCGRRVEADPPAGRHRELRLTTSGLRGYLLLRLLSRLRALRRHSYRMAWERVRLDSFSRQVLAVAGADYELGVIAAGAGDLVRGYGAVRRCGLAALRRFFEEVVAPAAANDTAEDRQSRFRRAREFLQQAAALTPHTGRQPA